MRARKTKSGAKVKRDGAGAGIRAVLYPRVSSDGQRDKHTIENQLHEGPLFVERMGWQLVRPPAYYADVARSAKTGQLDKRIGWARLVADAAEGEFDIVVVPDVDRLTRSGDQIERAAITGALQRTDVKIAAYLSGQVHDLDTLAGDLMVNMSAMFAAEENRKRTARIMEGKARAIREGRSPGGVVPWGLAFTRRDGWSLDTKRAPVVREVFERVLAGESCRAISADLVQRDVRTHRGNIFSTHYVWFLLKQTAYTGRWIVNREEGTTVEVPAIVTLEMFEAAQRQLRKSSGIGLVRTSHFYLGRDLMSCALCGAPIMVATGSARARTVSGYICARRHPSRARERAVPHLRPGESPCTLPRFRTVETDERIWTAFRSLILSADEHVEEYLARRREQAKADSATWRDDLRAAKAKLAEWEQRQTVILEHFRRGLIAEGAMEAQLTAAARERTLLEQQVRTASRASEHTLTRAAGAAALERELGALRKGLDKLKPDGRREALARLLDDDRLLVHEDGRVTGDILITLQPAVSAMCRVTSLRTDITRHTHSDVVRLALIA